MPNASSDLVRSTTPPTTAIWPLTPIDRFALQWLIQGTWLFDERIDANDLKHGVARLLDAYPLLGGRIVAGKRIERTDAGVPVVEASDPAVSIRDFGPDRVDVTSFGERHAIASIAGGRAPLLTVKLTHVRDGCVLALCCSHACLDGNSFYSMARNLSRATRGEPFAQPVFERSLAKPRSWLKVMRAARRAGWHSFTVVDAVRHFLARPHRLDRSFAGHFSPATLQRCKQELTRRSGCERLSSSSALVAHVASCLATLLGLDSTFALSVLVDQRGRVASLADDFAGNAVSVASASKIPARADAAEIAARLHGRLAPLVAKPSPELEALARLTHEVAGHRLPYSPIPASSMLGRRPTLFYTNSFAKFPIYDLDFGSPPHPIRPVRVVPHNLGDPIVLWPAPPSVGGVELYFSGSLARAVQRLAEDDPWWAALRGVDDEDRR